MKELIRRPKVYKLYGDKKEDGKKFVMESKYAVVLLAGGQGSRLEVKGAKGKYNVPFTSGKIKSIFEIQAKKLQKLNVPLYVMVSTDNEKDTKEFFKALLEQTLDKFELGDYGYKPFTIDEFIITFMGNLYLYDGLMDYFLWGYDILKKKK